MATSIFRVYRPERKEWSIQLLWNGDDGELERTRSRLPERTPSSSLEYHTKGEGVRALVTVSDDTGWPQHEYTIQIFRGMD